MAIESYKMESLVLICNMYFYENVVGGIYLSDDSITRIVLHPTRRPLVTPDSLSFFLLFHQFNLLAKPTNSVVSYEGWFMLSKPYAVNVLFNYKVR